ncbi:L domain-like protein [Anaeromyces robustus]|jgi:hypothetical protein|uniref:L domain-like protein n=1 Tax=Anaeromyces robustus TaxID=1754192 RepID=A0A1Y1X1H0_9FUNG|nr:L domain-like protein [Anaeromyces robustus]|eukprot:ORX79650.1 L domain-like protein [Anaeromyces robustus]
MHFLNKNLIATVATVLLFGSKVKAETDCEFLDGALQFLNDDIKKVFNVDKCCDFNGVRCDKDKNIIELKFNNVKKTNDITNFVDKIANLKNLAYLDLANDNIEGAIPKSLGSLTSLKNLNLAKNKFKGTIPYELKNLQNLEQFNLEGNPDLYGYVPYLSNVKGCAFKDSALCDVKNALCKGSVKVCTEEDIKKTNAENGNPDATSVTYEGEATNRDMNVYDMSNPYSYGYTGYNNYSNYGSYDYNNYYGNNAVGYGDWSNSAGYDNSYYNNGNYGTPYDNSYSTGYDTSFYDNGNANIFSNFGPNYTESDGTSFFGSLAAIIFYTILFSLLLFLCCACLICRTCCCADVREVKGTTTTHTIPTSTYRTNETSIKVHDEPRTYTTTTTTTKPYTTTTTATKPYTTTTTKY